MTPSDYQRAQPFKYKCTNVKRKCVLGDIPFDLDPQYLEDIWTGVCPIFSTRLNKPYHSRSVDRVSKHTCSLDRIVPDKGYVKGNVEWVSNLANSIKQAATADDLYRVANHVNLREKEIARHETN